MSTIMHNFYRYTGSDIVSLMALLRELRVAYVKQTQSTLAKFAPRNKATREIDREKLLAWVEAHTATGERSPYNIDGSAVVYFFEEHIYVQFFTDYPFLYGEVEPKGVFIDCSYDGRGDCPDEVTEEEWAERYRVVNAILVDNRPSRDGLSFIFADKGDAFTLVYALEKEQ